jgi:hypothetical protein
MLRTDSGSLRKWKVEKLLLELLTRLTVISEKHEELADSDVEEIMSTAIYDGFLNPQPGFSLPDEFRMYSKEGDRLVKEALEKYIRSAKILADEQGLNFHERLAAFQNLDCTYGDSKIDYNDFFRHLPPDRYDHCGNPIGKRNSSPRRGG